MFDHIRKSSSKDPSWLSRMFSLFGTKNQESKVTVSYIPWCKKEEKEQMNNLRLTKFIKGLMTNNPKVADRLETFIGISNHLFDQTTYWICLRFQAIYIVFYVTPLILTIFRPIDEKNDNIEMVERYLQSCLVTQSLFFGYELLQLYILRLEYLTSVWNFQHVL